MGLVCHFSEFNEKSIDIFQVCILIAVMMIMDICLVLHIFYHYKSSCEKQRMISCVIHWKIRLVEKGCSFVFDQGSTTPVLIMSTHERSENSSCDESNFSESIIFTKKRVDCPSMIMNTSFSL